jgi:hypothetical protein
MLVLVSTASALAASPAAECRKACGADKKSCVAGSKALFRAAKAGCSTATDRKACTKESRGEFRAFKQSCGAALKSCRSCCSTTGAITAAACTGGGPGSPGSPLDTSTLCPEARGGLAAYWDWLNGEFHPLAQIPSAGLGWVPYQHTGYPLLGFLHPPGWTPEQLAAEQTVGVNLIRNDGAAAWRFLGTWTDVSQGIRALRDADVSLALGFAGNPGPVRTVCVNEGQATLAPGIFASGSNIALQAGAFTIIVIARATVMEGLGGGQVIWNTIVAPTAELDQLAFGVFLPIHFQLFVGQSTQDSDLDGVPDSTDAAPNDPTRS